MACPGHTGAFGTECDVHVTDSDLGHGICVHLDNPIIGIGIYSYFQTNIHTFVTKIYISLVPVGKLVQVNNELLTESGLVNKK